MDSICVCKHILVFIRSSGESEYKNKTRYICTMYVCRVYYEN